MSSRAYLSQPLNTPTLPAKIKCTRCRKTKPLAHFSKRERENLLSNLSTGTGTSNNHDVLCMPCCPPSQVTELECQGCDRWLSKDRFSKTMRRNPDHALCWPCSKARQELEPVASEDVDGSSSGGGGGSDSDADSSDDDDDDGFSGGATVSGGGAGTATASMASLSMGSSSSAAQGGVLLPPSSSRSNASVSVSGKSVLTSSTNTWASASARPARASGYSTNQEKFPKIPAVKSTASTSGGGDGAAKKKGVLAAAPASDELDDIEVMESESDDSD